MCWTKITSLMSWTKKYSFLKPTYLDDVERRVIAGDVFQVQYFGYSKLNKHAEGTARDKLSRYSVQHRTKRRLSLIEIRRLSLIQDPLHRDMIGLMNHWCYIPISSVNIPISSVKHVIYRQRDKLYGDYCVFTARDDVESCEGAQFMSCDSQDETSRIIQSFETAINIGSTH